MTTALDDNSGLAWRVFLGFGCAYFMSYAFRVVNSIVGADLARELHFSGGDLGLLTSVYLLSFGLMQLPLGVWLDRYPAAAVNSVLLLAAGTGALVFAASDTLIGLLLGRALIGVGVCACLMSAFRAFASWFSLEQQARLNLWMLVMGSSGALAVTSPAEALLPAIGWRGLFVLMGILAFAAAAFLWVRAPRGQPALDRTAWQTQYAAFARIFGTLAYWRLAPASFFVHGGFMALQGLWIALWWVNVDGLSRTEAAHWLFALNGVVLVSFFLLGAGIGAIERAGIRPSLLFGWGLCAQGLCLLWVVLLPQSFHPALWMAYSALGCVAQFSYVILNRSVATELSGRTSVALNFAIFAGGFALQWGLGALVDALVARGDSVVIAYQRAFGLLAAAFLLTLAWYALASRLLTRRGHHGRKRQANANRPA